LVDGATQAVGNFRLNGQNCVCNANGAWNCVSQPTIAQALAENGNTLSASSSSADSMPSYAVALIVIGALVLVMLLVVIVQLVALIRS
jgi:hypothetical protein